MTKRALLLFLSVIGLSIATPTLLSSCGSGVDCKDPANASSASCVATDVLEDCTASDLSGAISKYGPVVENEIANAPRNADGSIDWGSISGALETQIAEAGFCAISEIFSRYLLAPSPSLVTVGSSSKPAPQPADVRAEYEKLRAEHAHGKKVKVSKGVI